MRLFCSMSMRSIVPVVAIVSLLSISPVQGQDAGAAAPLGTAAGDRLAAEYFALRTAEIEGETRDRLRNVRDWPTESAEYRRQLHEMLGLDPLPQRTPLNAVITKTAEQDDFVVENLHFQSSPGLYVTGNLYRPKVVKDPLPTILYVCGHGKVKIDGVSYGNKSHYHFHGAWFARHGYVCLIIDTIQLGEIEGLHHGTYNLGMWWWLSRGYTPAGVEAWDCIRALDYLETRPEVDKTRFGVTGRSGGGAYSWWTAALDPRIKCAVPVAGITDLDDHVVRGCVEGHCDCMYMVNTYRWDYPMVAALVAPRPLLISNTDKDKIFPLEGVVKTYQGAREVFQHEKVPASLGLQITEGGHNDTQELRIHAMVWFDRFLKKEDRVITTPALKCLQPQELKVFETLPTDEINTKIQESFVPVATVPVPASSEQWSSLRGDLKRKLLEKTFGAWPDDENAGGLYLKQLASSGNFPGVTEFEFVSQEPYRLGLKMTPATAADSKTARPRIVLHLLTQAEWEKAPWEGPAADRSSTHFWFAPRGVGPTEWTRDPKKRVHVERRFYLLGETEDSARTWDVRRSIAAIRGILGEHEPASLTIEASGDASVWGLYAALFEDSVTDLVLTGLPKSHMQGPALLNVMKILDVPHAVALASEHARVKLTDEAENDSRLSFVAAVKRDASSAAGK